MRKISLAVALTLLASPISPAEAQVRSGAACKKLGQVSVSGKYKFTCIKKNSKLVWSKGRETQSAQKKPTPKPSPTPELPVQAILAQSLLEEVWKVPIKSQTSYRVLVEPGQSNELAGRLIEIVNLSLDFFAKLNVDIETDSTVYIGRFSWLNNYVPRNSWCYNATYSWGGSCGEGILFLNLAQIPALLGDKDKAKSAFAKRTDFVAQSVAAHEFAHQAQRDFAEKYRMVGVSFYPAWIREGAAELLKIAVYAKLTGMSYLEARDIYLYAGNPFLSCSSVKLREMLMSNNHPAMCNYTAGMLASEYLIATTKDPRSLFTFASSKVEEGGPDFKNDTGISLETYRLVMKEVFDLDIENWDLEVERYISRWAP